MLNTQPLGPTFGVEVKDIDLTTITATHLYPEIRAAFEHHSALLFRGQELAGADFERVAALFGPIENRETMSAGHEVEFKIPVLSNKTKDGLLPEDSLRLMNLQANMLWHTDSTFLPIPALVNLLTARVVPSSGGETQIASTRAAWKDMPADMKTALEGDKENYWYRLFLSDLHVYMGEFEEGQKQLDYLIKKHPNDVDLIYNKADLLIQQQKYEEAVKTYDEAAEKIGKPTNTVKTWVRRSLISLRNCMNQ